MGISLNSVSYKTPIIGILATQSAIAPLIEA